MDFCRIAVVVTAAFSLTPVAGGQAADTAGKGGTVMHDAPDFEIKLEVAHKEFDGTFCWFHPRRTRRRDGGHLRRYARLARADG